MRTWWIVLVVVGCGKQEEAPRSAPSAGSSVVVVPSDAVAVAADAPMLDAPSPVVAIDAAVAVAPVAPAAPAAPAGTTSIEVVAFVGLNRDKLMPMAKGWIGWVEQHFTKCELDEKVEPVTTTVTVTFKDDDVTFDLPKVPDKLAECIKRNIKTPYLGYDPTPPLSIGKTTFKVKLKIDSKAAPPPPDTSPVLHMGSKVKGARDKHELNRWLDANVARQLKPCIEATTVVHDLWKIEFEIDAAGAIRNVTAPDPGVATCVKNVLAAVKAPKASGSNTVEMLFGISK